MKKILIPLALFIASCSQPTQNNSVNVTSNDVPGFNVSNFAQVLKTNSDPQDIEKAINLPNNNVNNLDLNHDGQVDYLKVDESQGGVFTVIDQTSNSQSVNIATVNINRQNDVVNINGNQSYSGSNYNYTTHFSPTDYLLLAYLLRPHTYYDPHYSYGSYPSYYHHTIVHQYTNTTLNRNNVVVSKNVTNTSVNRVSLSDPSKSQKSFAVRNTSTPVKTGGFGTKTTSTITVTKTSTRTGGFGSGGWIDSGGWVVGVVDACIGVRVNVIIAVALYFFHPHIQA